MEEIDRIPVQDKFDLMHLQAHGIVGFQSKFVSDWKTHMLIDSVRLGIQALGGVKRHQLKPQNFYDLHPESRVFFDKGVDTPASSPEEEGSASIDVASILGT